MAPTTYQQGGRDLQKPLTSANRGSRPGQTHLGDGLPVADVEADERRDVVEAFPLQQELHPGVGFVQCHHLRDTSSFSFTKPLIFASFPA